MINGSVELLAWLEPALDAGGYEVEFLEMDQAPYARIRQTLPDLIVFAIRIEDEAAFRLLSVLRMDEVTRHVRILTYTTEYEGQASEVPIPAPTGLSASLAKPALPMN